MEPERSELFQGLVARTIGALEGRGLSVLPAAVASVIDGLIASAVERTGISSTEALHLAEPEQIAELIARADREERHACVRSLRKDKSQAAIASIAAGQLINALRGALSLGEDGLVRVSASAPARYRLSG